MNPLPRVRSGLLRHTLDKQSLVYDPRDDRVHLLDAATGCVLELLEERGWTAEGITTEVAARLNVTPDPDVLRLALEELRRADLLEPAAIPPVAMTDVTRRDIVRRMAMSGAAAFLIPTVATLSATRGYAQTNSGEFGPGRPCAANSECLSGVCCGAPTGVCSNTGCPVPNGSPCTANGQCASGSCSSGICAAAAGNLATCAACTSNSQCAEYASDPTKGCNNGVCGAGYVPYGANCEGFNCCSGSCSSQPDGSKRCV